MAAAIRRALRIEDERRPARIPPQITSSPGSRPGSSSSSESMPSLTSRAPAASDVERDHAAEEIVVGVAAGAGGRLRVERLELPRAHRAVAAYSSRVEASSVRPLPRIQASAATTTGWPSGVSSTPGLRPVDQHRAAEFHQRVCVQRAVVCDHEDVRRQLGVAACRSQAPTGWRFPAFTSCGWIRTISCRSGRSGEVVDREPEPLEHVLERVPLVVELRVPEHVRQQAERRRRRIEPERRETSSCCSCSSGGARPPASPTPSRPRRAAARPGTPAGPSSCVGRERATSHAVAGSSSERAVVRVAVAVDHGSVAVGRCPS